MEKSPRPVRTAYLNDRHLEKGKQVFAVERLSVPGEFAMNFQFADGAEYRISAIAYVTAGRMLRTEQNISVTGVNPRRGR